MAFIEVDPLNKAGKDIMDLYRKYHSSINHIEKEEILETACKKFRNLKSIKQAFLGNFQGQLYYELCQNASFSSDVVVVKAMTPQIEAYLESKGASRVELSPYRRKGHSKESTLSIERRIGIKAKQIEEINGFSVKESREFFRDGHAAAYLYYIVIPQLKKLLKDEPIPVPEYIDPFEPVLDTAPPKVRILYSVAATRSYLENIRVQFLIPFEAVTESSKALDYVVGKLALLDEYEAKHPILF